MYTWGSEDTSSWKRPGAYSYDPAKKGYMDKLADDAAKKGPRSYSGAASADPKIVGAKKNIRTESKHPVVFAVDVTGSMQRWPAEIFDRSPLIYQTLSQYKDDLEICFAAIGDAYCDDYPLQVNDFAKGVSLDDKIKALCPEGGGGGQISESYELFAQYMNTHCEMPSAEKPIMIIFGDEKFYNDINPDQVQFYMGDKLPSPLDSNKVWKELMDKFDIYYLQKPYGSEDDPGTDKMVYNHWAKAMGEQRIKKLHDSQRAVDVAMGLIAKLWGKSPDFSKNLRARQDDKTAEQVENVIKDMHPDTAPAGLVTRKRKR